jgi:deoxyribonuclease-4
MQHPQFGPAGNPDAFYAAGHKASVEMPAWLASQGLNAYEYQCSRGVTIREETARAIGEAARDHGIRLSVHAPYYINLATEDPTIAANTTRHILKSLEAARWLAADRVVFHIGGTGKQPRAQALERAVGLFRAILDEADKQGLLAGTYLAPETMGKQNQLGTLEEVLAFCAFSEWTIPAIDFGHLHAVTGGRYTTRHEYEAAFDLVAAKLGEQKAAAVHIHFSRIEFTKAGEKRHWTFADDFGPPHEPLLDTIAARGYAPRIVCESAGTQAADAKTMREYYQAILAGR